MGNSFFNEYDGKRKGGAWKGEGNLSAKLKKKLKVKFTVAILPNYNVNTGP